jgi:hypothetical protein
MIRGFDVLHNFISPVTGRILATENYVLVGNTLGIAVPAPDLIDLRLDLINLRGDFDIASSASYIIGVPNAKLPNAQVLNSLPDGFIFNTAGVVSTSIIIPIESLPDLAENNIWIGDATNRPTPALTIAIENLPALTENNIWIGDATNRPTPALTIAIENLPALTEDNIWVGDATNRPVESSNFVKGPAVPSLSDTVALWDGITGRLLKNSGFSIAELEALAEEAAAAAEEATAAAAEASAAAVEATGAAGEASLSAIAAAASAAVALFGGGKGRRGDTGRTGSTGASGAIGDTGLIGAAGASGKTTTVIDSNINITGGRIQNLAPSPSADFDAVSAKWVWDLLNDNIEIKWE